MRPPFKTLGNGRENGALIFRRETKGYAFQKSLHDTFHGLALLLTESAASHQSLRGKRMLAFCSSARIVKPFCFSRRLKTPSSTVTSILTALKSLSGHRLIADHEESDIVPFSF